VVTNVYSAGGGLKERTTAEDARAPLSPRYTAPSLPRLFSPHTRCLPALRLLPLPLVAPFLLLPLQHYHLPTTHFSRHSVSYIHRCACHAGARKARSLSYASRMSLTWPHAWQHVSRQWHYNNACMWPAVTWPACRRATLHAVTYYSLHALLLPAVYICTCLWTSRAALPCMGRRNTYMCGMTEGNDSGKRVTRTTSYILPLAYNLLALEHASGARGRGAVCRRGANALRTIFSD